MIESRIIYGVGVNDADYQVQKSDRTSGKLRITWVCPVYSRWVAMLQRCYSEKFHKRNPNYQGCTVCNDWLHFSKFKQWMDNQDWSGKHLDKDLITNKNKVYSPDNCCFISPELNTFVASFKRKNATKPSGVYRQERGTYYAQCKNPFKRTHVYLGAFSTEQQAHDAWRREKFNHCISYARKMHDARVKKAIMQLSETI